jgi:hypothetical protein
MTASSYIGTAIPGSSGSGASATSASVNISSAPTGDWVFVALAIGDTQTNLTAPTGWTDFGQGNEPKSHIALFGRMKQAGDTSTTFTWALSAKSQIVAIAYSGLDATLPIEGVVTSAHTTTTSQFATASSTPSGAGRWALTLSVARGTTLATSFTPDAALTERVDVCNTLTAFVALQVADSNQAVTTGSHSYTATSTGTDNHGVTLLAFLVPDTTSGTTATAALTNGTTLAATGQITRLGTLAAVQASTLTASASTSGEVVAVMNIASSLSAAAQIDTPAGVSASMTTQSNLAVTLDTQDVSIVGAPSWIGSAVPGATAGASGTTVTLDVTGAPLGHQMFAVVGTTGSQTAMTTPSGWTVVGETDENRSHVVLLTRTKQAGDTGVAVSWTTSAKFQAVALAYPGVDPTTPTDGYTATLHTATSPSYVAGPGAPSAASRWAFAGFFARGAVASSSFTPDAALTERVDVCNTSTAFAALQLADSNGIVSAQPHTYTSLSTQTDNHGISFLTYLVSAPVTTAAAFPTVVSTLSVAASVTTAAAASLTQGSSLSVSASGTTNLSILLAVQSSLILGASGTADLSQASVANVSATIDVHADAHLASSTQLTAVIAKQIDAVAVLTTSSVANTKALSGSQLISVGDSAALTAALAAAQPGDLIWMNDGNYTGTHAVPTYGNFTGSFVATGSGTPSRPITLAGGAGAMIDGGSPGGHYGLYVVDANWWIFDGFTVGGTVGASKGIMSDHGSHNVYQGLTVNNIGVEGVHMRTFSAYNEVAYCTIEDTGVRNEQFGEGLYLGSANSNWPVNSFGLPDGSDYTWVHHNKFARNAAEAIDIKEGTTGGIIEYNTFDGVGVAGQNSADSSIDAKGNAYLIRHNTVTKSPGASVYQDAFQLHAAIAGWGWNNIFYGNTFSFSPAIDGYGINIVNVVQNTVIAQDNISSGTNSGMSNLAAWDPVVPLMQRSECTVSAYIGDPNVPTSSTVQSTVLTVSAGVTIPVNVAIMQASTLQASSLVSVLVAWSIWNGSTEVPLSLEGVYDGNQVVPVTTSKV